MFNALQHIHFIRPLTLLLLPIAAGLWWAWQRQMDPLLGWRHQIEAKLLDSLLVGQKSAHTRPALRLLAGWLLAIVAIAGPTWRLEPSPFADDATPLMILLKADITMDAPDLVPSRLERAQLKIADIAQAIQGQPLGLIAYSGSAHVVLPPTQDTTAVYEMAAEISSKIMPLAGDRLDLALNLAKRILTDGGQGGSVAVLADTVDTDAALLQEATKDLNFPLQFLAINNPDSPEDRALRTVAGMLNANVQAINVKNHDVAAIVKEAARVPVPQQGELGQRWQEAGYWLVPLVAVLMLINFRREESGVQDKTK